MRTGQEGEKTAMKGYAVHDRGTRITRGKDVCVRVGPLRTYAKKWGSGLVPGESEKCEFMILEPSLLSTQEAKTEFAECLKGKARPPPASRRNISSNERGSGPHVAFSMFRLFCPGMGREKPKKSHETGFWPSAGKPR